MIATLLVWLMALSGVARDQQGLDGAEQAYRAKRYAEARLLYQAELSKPDAAHGPVLYNLGNCAFRLERHAEAVLFYRRALLRMPSDEQVIANLELAERQLGIFPKPKQIGSAILHWVDSLPPALVLILVTLLQGGALVGLLLLAPRRSVRIAMTMALALGLLGAARLAHQHWLAGPPSAVVLEDSIELHIEPHNSVAALVKLRAGELVRVEELSDHWIRVEHENGGGWTERGGVGLVE